MAEWKKILTSGSEGSFTDLTASALPTITQGQVLGIDGSGRITKFNTSSIATANAVTYVGTGGQENFIPRWTGTTTLSTSSLQEINGSITIGTPGDSGDTVYTDGLFTDFTANGTTIATAVDRFNEVLKGLAPPPAPTLDNIEVITGQGTNSLKLSFGGAVTTSSYTNCDGTGSSLTAVGFSSSFNQLNGSTENGTSFIRLGTYTASFNLNVLLNDDVVPNGSPFVNYNSRSFDVPNVGGEAYVLEINGVRYTESTSGTNALAGTYFNLTAVRTGSFPTNGQSFNIFSHRTGSVTVTSVLWRNGWNHAKVFQTASGGVVRGTTTYIDWINDPAAASGTFPITFTTPVTSSVTNTGVKWLSGVPYLTQSSYTFNTTASNYYKNVYSATTIAATGGSTTANGFSALTKVGATAVTIPDPAAATGADTLFRISSVHNVSNNTRLLSESVSSTINLNNSLGKNQNATLITARYLYDAVNTANDGDINSTTSTARENFCLEDFRIPSASYPDSSSLASATWPSGSTLGTGELLVYSGSVMYPTRALNSGNFSTANIFYTASGTLPNYSSLTGDRFYFRRFRNTSASTQWSQFTLQLSGSADGSVVTHAGSLSVTAIRVGIKVPGETGYRDPANAAPDAGTYTAGADAVGCGIGTLLSHTTGSVRVGFVTERIRPNTGINSNNGFIVRLHASSAWTGNIRGITISNPS